MYRVLGFYTNGNSGANFEDESGALHSFGRTLTQYSFRSKTLLRLELWDDTVLICLYEQFGIKTATVEELTLPEKRHQFARKWLWGKRRE